jgi:AbiU2
MSTMPTELVEVFQEFFQEYSIIRVKWRLYKQLFGNTECIDLLNRHGAHGFGVFQDVLIKDVILCITRMMNTSKEAWGDPANLATLLIDLLAHQQTALADKLTGIRDRIKPVDDGLRRWRDSQISRNDYAAFLDMKAGIDVLPPPSRQMVEDILSAMSEILKELRAHYPGLEERHEDVPHSVEFEGLFSHLRYYEERQANPPH